MEKNLTHLAISLRWKKRVSLPPKLNHIIHQMTSHGTNDVALFDEQALQLSGGELLEQVLEPDADCQGNIHHRKYLEVEEPVLQGQVRVALKSHVDECVKQAKCQNCRCAP